MNGLRIGTPPPKYPTLVGSINTTNLILMQVDEFSRDAFVQNLSSIEGHGFLVAWKWVELSEQGDENEEANAGYVVNDDETLSTDSDLEESGENDDMVSTVAFQVHWCQM